MRLEGQNSVRGAGAGNGLRNSSNSGVKKDGDGIFKQANSTQSNHGQRSNQTQSTAYSVRTASSGLHQTKSKLGAGSNLQSSQSPFTDNTSGVTGLSRKRSMYGAAASSDRPVYEQVEENEESGSATAL